MSNAVIAENFITDKKPEYTRFVENLGAAVCFTDDKWVCDKLRRSPADNNSRFTICFKKTPECHREIVKYFTAICIIQRKTITTVKTCLTNLNRFFNFWNTEFTADAKLSKCDGSVAVRFTQHLESRGYEETTKAATWSAVCTFFNTMNGWDDTQLKNPFSLSPYSKQRKLDDKYIPGSVTSQLDNTFKREDVPLHMRCTYWLLRLIPSRISEIIGMSIDCLKRYNGHYVIFIPTWKQNGGWLDPIMRSIHLEQTGIAEYLINLIKEQQNVARQLQEYMPEHKKGVLLTYNPPVEIRGQFSHMSNRYCVPTKDSVQVAFNKICVKNNIVGEDGQIYRVTTHQFRHNGITDRIAAGFTTAQIAEMTAHHGSAMIFNAYNHLNLLPETIIEKQEYVLQETSDRDNRYILFGGRILNMDEMLEKRLLKNFRAHKVRGGICSDITGCKNDMWNCLECEFFVPDSDQLEYYEEQALLWREKCVRFSDFPIIKGNAEKNAVLFEHILKIIRERKQLP